MDHRYKHPGDKAARLSGSVVTVSFCCIWGKELGRYPMYCQLAWILMFKMTMVEDVVQQSVWPTPAPASWENLGSKLHLACQCALADILLDHLQDSCDWLACWQWIHSDWWWWYSIQVHQESLWRSTENIRKHHGTSTLGSTSRYFNILASEEILQQRTVKWRVLQHRFPLRGYISSIPKASPLNIWDICHLKSVTSAVFGRRKPFI